MYNLNCWNIELLKYWLIRFVAQNVMMKKLIPPANKVCEGYVFTGVCLSIGGRSLHRGGGFASWMGGSASEGVDPPRIGYYGIRSTSRLYASYWFAFSLTKLLDVFFLLQRVLRVKRRAEAWPTRWSWSRRLVTRPPRAQSPRPRSDPSHRNSSTRNSKRPRKGDRFVERFMLFLQGTSFMWRKAFLGF